MNYCNQCGSVSLQQREQVFKNGTKHIRVTCRDCGTFNGFAKQNNGYDIIVAKDHSGDIEELRDLVSDKLTSADLNGRNVTLIAKVR